LEFLFSKNSNLKEEINPWKINHSKEVYNNKWIRVTEHDVVNPSGNNGIYGVVHFKNTAVGVIPLDEENNTWLVGQYRFSLNQYSWEIPEGGAAFDEDPVKGAARELEEETGLKASIYTRIVEMHLSNSVSDEYAVVYLAQGLSQHMATPEETEQLVVKKVPFQTAYDMVEQGIITDSMSVAAILKVKLMLLQQELPEVS
jgi:8-oxo-dGTP pyrophosphatase MutT (NUDIX family)